MKEKIRIGIVGYGNLGKGTKLAISQNPDMELVAIFTRRPTNTIENANKEVTILNTKHAIDFIGKIDVMILCGGSSVDIPIQGPYFSKMFNTVDGYDNHKNISAYLRSMDEATKAYNKTSIISVGWDPGLFSMNRLLLETILPNGSTYTFWGPGVSQGHSDAIRRIPGVKKAIQYTLPDENSLDKIRKGKTPSLTNRDKHKRECYVVAEDYADKDEIVNTIVNMPNYFKDYDTKILFVSEKELNEKHSKLFHGGTVIRNGKTGVNSLNTHTAEFSLKLDSNSEFTANILVTYARAVHKLNREGCFGAKTIFDIPLKYLTTKSLEDLYTNML